MESQTAKCHICKSVLPLDSFHKDRTRRSGHSTKCKACKRKINAVHGAAYRKRLDWAAYQRERLKDDSKRSRLRGQQSDWRNRNPLATRAHTDVHVALKNGSLVRPQECSECTKPCTPEAHHEDYEKPLDVTWLCRLCHEARHHQKEKAS